MSINQINQVVLAGVIDDDPRYSLDSKKGFARLRVKTTRSFMLNDKREDQRGLKPTESQVVAQSLVKLPALSCEGAHDV